MSAPPNTPWILDWRSIRKGQLLGFVQVPLSSGMLLSDVAVMNGSSGTWVSPPAKPRLDKDGAALRDQNGKILYTPVVEFASKELRDKFSSAVIAALKARHPEALAE